MKPLADFIMRSDSRAVLVTAVAALLSLLIPFMGLISAAAVGLVTLRNGTRRGLLVSGLATLVTSLFAILAWGSPWPVLAILAVFWVPVWILASVLRSSRSLIMAVQLAAMFGLMLVLTFHVIVGDPVDYWRQLLEPLRQNLVTDGILEADVSLAVFSRLSHWMTGSFSAAFVFQLLVSLFIARWWQAALYNPGGFGEEFRALRLSRMVGAPILALLAWLSVDPGAGLVADLLLVLGVLLVVQGLAVAHGIRQTTHARAGWMVGLYLLLVLFMPQALLLMACVGLVDIWVDIRARVARKAKSLG
jgi:hypothetical protein